MAEGRQTFDAVFLIVLVPRPNRVVVDEQHPGYRLACHAVIEKQDRVGPTPQTVRRRPVASQVDHVFARFRVKEAAADHEKDQNRGRTDSQGVFSGSRRVGVYIKSN